MEIKTKYNIGDKVWAIDKKAKTPICVTINLLCVGRKYAWFECTGNKSFLESEMFATEEELLASLIK